MTAKLTIALALIIVAAAAATPCIEGINAGHAECIAVVPSCNTTCCERMAEVMTSMCDDIAAAGRAYCAAGLEPLSTVRCAQRAPQQVLQTYCAKSITATRRACAAIAAEPCLPLEAIVRCSSVEADILAQCVRLERVVDLLCSLKTHEL